METQELAEMTQRAAEALIETFTNINNNSNDTASFQDNLERTVKSIVANSMMRKINRAARRRLWWIKLRFLWQPLCHIKPIASFFLKRTAASIDKLKEDTERITSEYEKIGTELQSLFPKE